MNVLRTTAAFVLLSTSLIATASTEAAKPLAIKPFTADYQASWKGLQADANMSLVNEGKQWRYELRISNGLGNTRQITVFDLHNGTFRPLSGTDTTQVLFKNSQKQVNYDWAQGLARWSGDVKPDRLGPVELRDGDLDGMLLNLALVRDVHAEKPLDYRLVENGVARMQHYQVLGQEPITVNGQAYTATKIRRDADNKQVLVWIVDGLPVPARILQKKDGRDDLELRLKALR